jgi:hypothetical protein
VTFIEKSTLVTTLLLVVVIVFSGITSAPGRDSSGDRQAGLACPVMGGETQAAQPDDTHERDQPRSYLPLHSRSPSVARFLLDDPSSRVPYFVR